MCCVPEKDEFLLDFKKHLIKVFSCEDHDISKDQNDLFFRDIIRAVEWNNVFSLFRCNSSEKHEFDFSEKGELNISRLLTCIELITKGIYFKESGSKLKNTKLEVVIGFLEINSEYQELLRMQFESPHNKIPKTGIHKQLFYYQLKSNTDTTTRYTAQDFEGGILRLVFYEGAEFFVSFN